MMKTYPIEQMSQDEKLVWMALGIDCEGYVSLWKKRYEPHDKWNHKLLICVQIGFTNDSEELVRLFYRIAEMGRVRKLSGISTHWRWEVMVQKDIMEFLIRIEPYLVVKRKKANLVIDFCKSRLYERENSMGRAIYSDKDFEIVEIFEKVGMG
jgi:hypothetical protein